LKKHTRDVLGQKFATNNLAFFATVGKWVPNHVHNKISIVSRPHGRVFDHTLPKNGAINEDIDVEIGDGSRVVRRIREIYVKLQSERCRRGTDNLEVADFGCQGANAFVAFASVDC
jgi:hypothetical protein